MEALLTRYRNLSVLLLAIFGQLILLAYQVKTHQDVRLIRVWAVSIVTPVARVLEFVRENTIGVAENYFVLVNVRGENERLNAENGKLKIENQFLKAELQTADRVRALSQFQQRTASRTLPARVIGTGTGANSRSVFIDQGSAAGVKRGMAVITPDGIVGKVLASYPTASQVLMITDPSFAAGAISDKNRTHGTVKGIGQDKVIVDYVQNEEKVDVGEMFYTSGDDRIFPKGMPIGKVAVVRQGRTFKEIYLNPTGPQQGLEEVLVVIEGVDGTIPDAQEQKTAASPDMYLQPAPAASAKTEATPSTGNLTTEADRVREKYKKIEEQQGVTFGERGKIPDFNARPTPQPGSPASGGTASPTRPRSTNNEQGGTGNSGSAPATGTPRPSRPTNQDSGAPAGQNSAPVNRPRPGGTEPGATGAGSGAVRQPAGGSPAEPNTTRSPQPRPATTTGTPGERPPASQP